MSRFKTGATLLAAMTSTVLCSTALAQSPPAEQNPGVSEPDPVGLGDIIVTARKRSESLKDIPVSIQAFDERQLDALNARSLTDLNGTTPSVRIAPNGSVAIRGISSNTRNIGFEAGAAVYIDGVYQGRPPGNNQDLVDIQRVEILRGPQGTLYGKNTTAGAISLITVRPGDTFTGEVDAQYGERNDFRVSAYAAGPITDQIGAKLAVFHRRSDGYQVNVASGQQYGLIDTLGARGELRFTPGAWDISIRGDYLDDHSLLARNEPVVGFSVVPGIDTVVENVPASEHTRGGGLSLTVDRDVGGLTVTSITAQRWLRAIQRSDPDFSLRDIADYTQNDGGHQFSEELRLVSPSSGKLTYVVGLYYFRQRLNSNRPLYFGADWPAITGGFLNSGFITNVVSVGTDTYAAFANADYKLLTDVTLNAGIRYTKENKNLDFVQNNPDFVLPYPDFNVKSKMSDSDLSPTVSLSWAATPAVTAYVRYSQGFKSGGWNPDFTAVPKIDFGPEKVANYEVGVKTQLFDNRLSLNVTGYYMDYADLQVVTFVSTALGRIITNAGKARIKGLEVEMLARPAPWLNLSAGGAITDAKYTSFDNGTGTSYEGQQFTNTPEYTFYTSADARIPAGVIGNVVLHGDYRYQSGVFFDDNRTVVPIGPFARGGYGLVNLRAGVATPVGLELSVFVDNLADKRFLTNRARDTVGLGIITNFYGVPRQFGARATYRF